MATTKVVPSTNSYTLKNYCADLLDGEVVISQVYTKLVDYYPLGISYVYLHIFGPIRLMLLDTFHETICNHGF